MRTAAFTNEASKQSNKGDKQFKKSHSVCDKAFEPFRQNILNMQWKNAAEVTIGYA